MISYIECLSGNCTHAIHVFNGASLPVILITMATAIYIAVRNCMN